MSAGAGDGGGGVEAGPPESAGPGGAAGAPGKVLLVGNPNVGKSVFFGLLTGRYAVVSNYPGTTVEVSRGRGRVGGREVEVTDTPGANSLSPNSEDERVARDAVLEPGERTVLQVADAKNLRRALLLTAQLAELEVPMVLALNMWDEAHDRGIRIDAARLGQLLGVPVVPTVATERRGVHRLFLALGEARAARLLPRYGHAVEAAAEKVSGLLPPALAGRRGLALMLLARGGTLEDRLAETAGPGFREEVDAARSRLAAELGAPLALVLQRRRAAHVDRVIDEVQRQEEAAARTSGPGRSLFFWLLGPAFFYLVGWRVAVLVLHALLAVLRQPGAAVMAWGPVLAHVAGAVSLVLFSRSMWRREYAGGGTALGALARFSAHPVGGFVILVFVLWAVYQVVGVFGAGDCVDFARREVFGTHNSATGDYGGLVNGPLSRWVAGAVGRGSLAYELLFSERAGLISVWLVYALGVVLPIVILFFGMFSVMEDSGYLPRLSLLADRVLKRVGLSGKAVLPMVLGLGCGTMAMLATRVLETRRQRTIAALLLGLAVPCSAQLGVMAAMLAAVSPGAVAVYALVIGGAFLGTGAVASRVLPGEAPDLLLEVPPFRWPQPWNVLVKTYHRVKWFMREAVPLFLVGTVCLFVAEKTGLMGFIEAAVRPVVSGVLGLPPSTAPIFLLVLLRRDFATLLLADEFRQGHVTGEQALVALVVLTLFVPCLAHFLMCVKELGWRRALWMDAAVMAIAVAVGFLVRVFLLVTGLRVVAGG